MEKSQKKAQKRTSTGDTEVHDGNTTKVVDCKDQGRRAEKDMVSSIACISVRLCKEMLLKPRYLFWPAVPSSEPLSCHTSGIWGGEQHVTRVGDWWSGGREEALHKDANPTALLGQEAWVTDIREALALRQGASFHRVQDQSPSVHFSPRSSTKL